MCAVGHLDHYPHETAWQNPQRIASESPWDVPDEEALMQFCLVAGPGPVH